MKSVMRMIYIDASGHARQAGVGAAMETNAETWRAFLSAKRIAVPAGEARFLLDYYNRNGDLADTIPLSANGFRRIAGEPVPLELARELEEAAAALREDEALADTQRAIIEAAERRGYERGLSELRATGEGEFMGIPVVENPAMPADAWVMVPREAVAQAAAALDVLDRKPLAAWLMRAVAHQDEAGDEVARLRLCERRLAAMTRWLEAEQSDVFRRGLWDAINAAAPTPAEPQECGAIGSQGCTYRPEGPNGEMQCTYCGDAPAEPKGGMTHAEAVEAVVSCPTLTVKSLLEDFDPPAEPLRDTGAVADVLWRIDNEAHQFIDDKGMIYLRYLRDLLAARPAPQQPAITDAMVERACEAFNDAYDGVSHNTPEAIRAALIAAQEGK